MTTLKFVYHDQIHKVSPLPKTFCSLSSTLQLLLKNSLPESYTLQYQDSEGERVMLTGEEDYKAMLMTELPQDPNKSVRIYISSRDDKHENKSFINNSYTSTENTRRSGDISSHMDSNSCLKALKEAESANTNTISDCMKALITCTGKMDEGEGDMCSSDEEEKEDNVPCEFATKKGNWSIGDKDDFKNKKKQLKRDIKIQRHLQKSEFIKGMLVDLLYDNFANLARVVGAYVRDPSVDLDRLVNELRPRTCVKDSLDALSRDLPMHGKPGGMMKAMMEHHQQSLQEDKKRGATQVSNGTAVREPERGGYFTKKIKCPIAEARREEIDAKKKSKLENPPEESQDKWRAKGKPPKEEHHQSAGGPRLKFIPKQEAYNNFEYNMEFVREVGSVPNCATSCDSVVYKTILIRNNGSKEWPRSALLIPKGEVRSEVVRLKNLRPGEEISPVLVLKNPGTPGDYISEWKLAYKDEQGRTIYTSASIRVNLKIHSSEDRIDHRMMLKACPSVMKKIEELKKLYPQTDCNFILEVIKQASPDSSVQDLAQELKKRLS